MFIEPGHFTTEWTKHKGDDLHSPLFPKLSKLQQFSYSLYELDRRKNEAPIIHEISIS